MRVDSCQHSGKYENSAETEKLLKFFWKSLKWENLLKETKGINPNAKQRYAWENGVKTVSKVVNINKPKIIKVF